MNTAARMVFFVCLVAPATFLPQETKANLVSDHETFIVTIVGYDQDIQYSVEYGIVPSEATPKVLSPVNPQANREMDPLGELVSELRRRREERREAAKRFKFPFPEPVKWVNPSPNGQYVLVGFEDPSLEVMTRAIVVRAANFERLKELKFRGRSYIQDSEWSSDSRVLAILETSGRWSLAPRDLLFALAGHGASLNTVFVNLVSVGSGDVTRTLITKDVRYGTAIITRAKDRATKK